MRKSRVYDHYEIEKDELNKAQLEAMDRAELENEEVEA